MGSGQVVMVRREKIAACMTCPLCNNLLKDATTISLCLHTFCRKCIYERLSDEDIDNCPVCDINLGCIPVDKLRPDHNLQDIRAKVFPFKRRKVEAPEITPTDVSPPAKRKERSLSSLVVNTPRVSSQGGVTGRRTRAGVRKGSASSRGTSPLSPKNEDDSMDDHADGSSSPETLTKIKQNKKQSSSAKTADQSPEEQLENNKEGKKDLWKPLNNLVEAANRSKFSKPGPARASQADDCMMKIKSEENGQSPEVNGEKTREPVKRKRMRKAYKKRLTGYGESSGSKLILNVARRNWRDGPIWFSLVASGDQEGVDPLPHGSDATDGSAVFLCVKDASTPVSFISKYLVKKLNLSSEDEVQIMCHGQLVLPHLKISSLLDLWLRTSSTPKKVKTFVGEAAKDYVMVLSYLRKSPAPTPAPTPTPASAP